MVFETVLNEVKMLINQGYDTEAKAKLEDLIAQVENYVKTLPPPKRRLWADTVSELSHALEHFPYISANEQRMNILVILNGIVV